VLQRVDLHVHTRLSKTFAFREGVIDRLQDLGTRRGLNGFALTEHIHASDFWGMHEYLRGKYRYQDGFYDLGGFKMFSGCEVTVAERVDFIVVGPVDEVEKIDNAFYPKLSEEHFVPALELLAEARKRDVIVISAHPYRVGKETAKLPLDRVFSHVDAIEVNGRDHGGERAVAALAQEYDRPVSGGSDAHYYLQVGVRSTVVPAPELSLGSIARAFERRETRAHCKAYAPTVVGLCQDIKRVVKLREEQRAAKESAA
jgi:histidinol phosphatase-like PHP family hydrolase